MRPSAPASCGQCTHSDSGRCMRFHSHHEAAAHTPAMHAVMEASFSTSLPDLHHHLTSSPSLQPHTVQALTQAAPPAASPICVPRTVHGVGTRTFSQASDVLQVCFSPSKATCNSWPGRIQIIYACLTEEEGQGGPLTEDGAGRARSMRRAQRGVGWGARS